MAEEEFKYDAEAEENTRKYRLPFALCKAQGIAIQDWWTPRDAWEALKRGGRVDDVSEEYAAYYRELKRESNLANQKECEAICFWNERFSRARYIVWSLNIWVNRADTL